jgi:hypothetical protein
MDEVSNLVIALVVVGVAHSAYVKSRQTVSKATDTRTRDAAIREVAGALLLVGGLAWFFIGHSDDGGRTQEEHDLQRLRGLLAFFVVVVPGVVGAYTGNLELHLPAAGPEQLTAPWSRTGLVGRWLKPAGVATVALIALVYFVSYWRKGGFFYAIDGVASLPIWLGVSVLLVIIAGTFISGPFVAAMMGLGVVGIIPMDRMDESRPMQIAFAAVVGLGLVVAFVWVFFFFGRIPLPEF